MSMEGDQAPWAVMYDTIIGVLHRTRSTHRLALTAQQVIEPLLPHGFEAQLGSNSVQWGNARRAIRFGTLVYFSLQYGDDTFWMRVPHDVPIPVERGDGFVVANSHPHYSEIWDWFRKAKMHEDSLFNMRMWLHEVFRGLGSWSNVKRHFPEVVPYLVGIDKKRLVEVKEVARPGSKLHLLTERPKWRNTLRQQLTLGALCPEDFECSAWVGEADVT